MTQKTPPGPQAPSRKPIPQAGPVRADIDAVVARFDAGRFADVEAMARALTRRFPRHPFGWNALGAALQQLGRLEDALPALRQAVNLTQRDPEAQGNLGIVLLHLGRLAEAEPVLRRALQLAPKAAAFHSNLGAVLLGLGRPGEAEASYRRTVELAPDYAEARANLGLTLLDQNRLEEAETSLRRALALAPDYESAQSLLGAILADRARPDDALAAHRRALALRPDSLPHRLRACLALPPVQAGAAETALWRRRYEQGIAALAAAPPARLESVEGLNLQTFPLAAHGLDDRPLLEALGRMLRATVPNLTAAAPHLAAWQPPAAGTRIRIGFLSKFFSLHSVGKLFRGIIQHLDRDRFEIVVLHADRSRNDEFRQDLDTLADKAVALPAMLAAQQRAVAAEALDVLVYPDIGLTSATYFLAFARLAPVQVAGFGHPETSGLDSLDYFLSAEAAEPEGAEAHYTERLIRLERLPSFYRMPEAASSRSRTDLGLPDSGTLYGCLHAPHAIHPEFDAVLARIAAGDPDGRIVLLEGPDPAWSAILRARWAMDHPLLAGRTVFLPPLAPSDFLALMPHLDVALDPIHAGGGTAFYETIAFGTPVVTWPGPFLRGRLAAGAYRQMGVADAPVAARLEDYAPLALALGRDPERRQALKRSLAASAGRELFEDRQVLRALETFFEAAVAAAGRGERLPAGWTPGA